jgi:hypothetical protein
VKGKNKITDNDRNFSSLFSFFRSLQECRAEKRKDDEKENFSAILMESSRIIVTWPFNEGTFEII